MRAFGRKTRGARWPLAGTLMWAGVVGLVGWGLWQGYQVRKVVLARAHRQSASDSSHQTVPQNSTNTDSVANKSPPQSVIERVFVSSHGGSPWELPHDGPRPPRVVAVLSPGVLAQARHDIHEARQNLQHGRMIATRNTLNHDLQMLQGFGQPQAATIRQWLGRLNRRTLLVGGLVPDDPLTRVVSIQPGESLDYLAYLYRITPRLLAQLNPGINARKLRPGSGLKVILGPFDARLILHAARIDVVDRHMFILSLPIHTPGFIPIAPGRYRLKTGGEAKFNNPLGVGHGYRITLVPAASSVGASLRTVVITTPPTSAGEIEISPRPMHRLFELLSPKFSRVEILP